MTKRTVCWCSMAFAFVCMAHVGVGLVSHHAAAGEYADDVDTAQTVFVNDLRDTQQSIATLNARVQELAPEDHPADAAPVTD